MPPPSRFARKMPMGGNVHLQLKTSFVDEPDAFKTFAVNAQGDLKDPAAVASVFNIEESTMTFETVTNKPVLGSLNVDGRYLVCGDTTAETAESRRKILFAYDDVMLDHQSPLDRVPEAPQRLRRATQCLIDAGFMREEQMIPTRPATLAEVTSVHDSETYRDFVVNGTSLAEKVALPSDVYCHDNSSSRAALMACGLTIDMACRLLSDNDESIKRDGEPPAGFCLVRPPGHHCAFRQPSGFCLINNAVVASKVARTKFPQCQRVAIVDFDVHHGDGTQSLTESDPDTLFVSLHRHDQGKYFPHTGALVDTGSCNNCVNIPFDTACTDPEKCFQTISDYCFDAAAENVIAPALRRFKPDLMIISCGFDAAEGDPLGAMSVVNGFERITIQLRNLAKELSAPLCFVLEGGYHLENVGNGVVTVATALSRTGDVEPAKPAVPRRWVAVRKKQEQQHAVWEEAQAKRVAVEEDDDTCQPELAEPPCLVLPTAELMTLHNEWIETTMKAVREQHKL